MDIKFRRGTSVEWAAANPVLPEGLAGYDKTLKKIKIGDGISTWSDLLFIGGEEVTYTLTTLPGYGVVPDATVADYTALDAYSTLNTWVEVTTGDTGTEIFYYSDNAAGNGTPRLFGPFQTWIKNPKYIFGSNGETRLVVNVDRTPLIHPSDSSRYVGPAFDETSGDTDVWAQIRTARCVPIHCDANTLAVDTRYKIVNADGQAGTEWVLVNGVGASQGEQRNHPLTVLSVNNKSAALWGNESSLEFVKALDGQLWVDGASYSGFAGLPTRYAGFHTNGGQYCGTNAAQSTGVIEWDYHTLMLRNAYDIDTPSYNNANHGDHLTWDQNTSNWVTTNPDGFTHVLTALPGHGVVPSVTVADYAALDVYTAGNPFTTVWVEVTTGDTGTEIFRWESGALYGPFQTWIKNPKYIFGANGETKLVVSVDLSLNPIVHPENSSKYTAPVGTNGQAQEWAQIRTAMCIPIYCDLSIGNYPNFKIVNTAPSAADWVMVIGVTGNGQNRPLAPLLNGLGITTTAILQGASSSLSFLVDNNGGTLGLKVDASTYPGIAGLPARWATSSTNYTDFLATRASTGEGVVEWDYQTYSLQNLADYNQGTPNNGDTLVYSSGTGKWVPQAPATDFSAITNKPTTLAGYGIETEVNTKVAAAVGIDLVRYLNMPGTLAVFTGKLKWYPPLSVNLLYIFPHCDTAPTGANINISLLKNGSEVATASITAGSSVGAKTPLTGITALDTDYFTINVTSVGSTAAGADMVIALGYEYI